MQVYVEYFHETRYGAMGGCAMLIMALLWHWANHVARENKAFWLRAYSHHSTRSLTRPPKGGADADADADGGSSSNAGACARARTTGQPPPPPPPPPPPVEAQIFALLHIGLSW